MGNKRNDKEKETNAETLEAVHTHTHTHTHTCSFKREGVRNAKFAFNNNIKKDEKFLRRMARLFGIQISWILK